MHVQNELIVHVYNTYSPKFIPGRGIRFYLKPYLGWYKDHFSGGLFATLGHFLGRPRGEM